MYSSKELSISSLLKGGFFVDKSTIIKHLLHGCLVLLEQFVDLIVGEVFAFRDTLDDITLINARRVEDIPLCLELSKCFITGG